MVKFRKSNFVSSQKKNFIPFGLFLVFLLSMISIFSVLLSYVCVPQKPYFTSALAKEISEKHNRISEAYTVSKNFSYHDIIPAYESAFYRISLCESMEIRLTSKRIKSISVKIVDEAGSSLSVSRKYQNSSMVLRPHKEYLKKEGYIFLELKNRNTKKNIIQIRVLSDTNAEEESIHRKKKKPENKQIKKKKKPETNITLKSQKREISKQTNKRNRQKKYYSKQKPVSGDSKKSDKPSKPMSTALQKERTRSSQTDQEKQQYKATGSMYVNPHLIRLQKGEKRQLLKCLVFQKIHGKNSFSKKDFIWLSTDKETADVKNGVIHAKKEGISIIYIKHKKRSYLCCTCLVKVLS